MSSEKDKSERVFQKKCHFPYLNLLENPKMYQRAIPPKRITYWFPMPFLLHGVRAKQERYWNTA